MRPARSARPLVATAPLIEGRVCVDLVCLGCGYNLRTLDGQARCPECGRAVADTLAWALDSTNVLWLRRVRAGALVIGWTTVVLVALSGLILAAGGLLKSCFGLIAALTAPLAYAAGTIRFGTRRPDEPAPSSFGSAELVSMCPLATLLLLLMTLLVASAGLRSLATAIALMVLVGPLLLPALAATHARDLLIRVGKNQIAPLAQFVAILGLVLIGLYLVAVGIVALAALATGGLHYRLLFLMRGREMAWAYGIGVAVLNSFNAILMFGVSSVLATSMRTLGFDNRNNTDPA